MYKRKKYLKYVKNIEEKNDFEAIFHYNRLK